MPPRRRRYTNKPKRKSSTPRALPVTLNPEVWLHNSKDIADWRDSMLIEQDYMCAISGLPLTKDTSVADHCHSNGEGEAGRMRGVLENSTNALEGMFLSKFNKLKMKERYGLDFPTFLINMGEYLQQDNSRHPYHVSYMTDLRNYIKRLTRSEIASKIRSEFKIDADEAEPKGELVQKYMQAFVCLVELNDKLSKEK